MILALVQESLSWFTTWPELVRLPIFFLLPGYLLALAAGLRRPWRIFATPIFAAAWVSACAILFPFLHLKFWPRNVLLAAAIGAGIIFALRYLGQALLGATSGDTLGATADKAIGHPAYRELGFGAIAGLVLLGGATMIGIGDVNLPPQTYDSIYHLSATRVVAYSGSGSPFHVVARMNPNSPASFYPAGWHDAVAMIVSDDVVRATNVMVLVGVLLAAMYIGYAVAFALPVQRSAFTFGVIATSLFVAYPYRLISYGTVWPVFWSYVWVAAFIAIAAALWQVWRASQKLPRLSLYVLAIATVFAAGTAQPSAVFAIAYFSIIIGFMLLLAALISGMAGAYLGEIILVVIGVVVAVCGALAASQTRTFKGIAAYTNPVDSPASQALWGALSGGQLADQGYGSPRGYYVVVVLCLLGALIALRRQQAWLVPTWAFTIFLFWASLAGGGWATLAAPWYNNSVRIGGLVPLLAAPLAGIAITEVVNRLASLFSRQRSKSLGPPKLSATLLAAIIVLTGVGVTSVGFRLYDRAKMVRINYRFVPESGLNALISSEEAAMIRRVEEKIPNTHLVLGSPLTGSAALYAISGRQVLYPAIGINKGADHTYLGRHFNEIYSDPKVCELVRKYSADYVYYDSLLYWPQLKEREKYAGLENLEGLLNQFELIDQGGTAAIYRIPERVCGPIN